MRWRSQLQNQHGVVSRQQAHDAGFREDAIDRRLRSGTWQRLYRGVYATFSGALSRDAKLWAVVLCSGTDAALSHQTAAELHGLIDKPISTIHISVPATRRPVRKKIRGVVIHRSRGLVAEWQPPWHLPRTTVEDTVLDLIAAARTFDDAYGWISAAVGRRLTTPELLGKALALPHRRGDRRGPAQPGLDRHPAPVRLRVHRGRAAGPGRAAGAERQERGGRRDRGG
jgi:hypothetical protein